MALKAPLMLFQNMRQFYAATSFPTFWLEYEINDAGVNKLVFLISFSVRKLE